MKIKAVLSDIDGTITDGRTYSGKDGYMFKCFEPHIGSGLDILKENNIPIHFFTSGVKGYSISRQFTEMYSLPCSLASNIQYRIAYVKEIIDLYKEVEGNILYLGDSNWDSIVVKSIEEDMLVICPSNATFEMKGVSSEVSDRAAGDAFFYHTIYKTIK